MSEAEPFTPDELDELRLIYYDPEFIEVCPEEAIIRQLLITIDGMQEALG